MIWPIQRAMPGSYYTNARVKQVVSDEVSGNLQMRVVFDEHEEQGLIYEGMYYSQLDESSVGLVFSVAAEVTPAQLKAPEYRSATVRLYEECGADNAFLADMFHRGNRFFIHKTEKDVYLVLAKRLIWEKQDASANAAE